MSDTEHKLKIKDDISPETKVKMSLRLFIWLVIGIAANVFVVAGAYFNFSNAQQRMDTQLAVFIDSENKANDRFQSQLDAMKTEVSADEKIITADENNHALFAQMVNNRLNIKQ